MSDLSDVTNPLVTQEDINDHFGIGMIVRDQNGNFPIFFHEKYQFWTIPIGKAPSKDVLYDMVQIEAFEELGIAVKTFESIGSFTKVYDRKNGIQTKITSVIFNITSFIGEIKNNEPKKHPHMMLGDEYFLEKLILRSLRRFVVM